MNLHDVPFPADAAGTAIDLHGLPVVFAGDDESKFRAAGLDTIAARVLCSAKVAAGEQTLPGDFATLRVAIDCNGMPWQHVARLAGLASARPALGIYNGDHIDSVLGMLPREQIVGAHDRLLVHLAGFGCFAILANR